MTKNGRIESITGDVNLILGDGCTLNVKGLFVPPGKTLTIYGQSAGTGLLHSETGSGAAIGAGGQGDSGTITISGGDVTAASTWSAGIGGSQFKNFSGSIRITGGTVDATASLGAGIGAGHQGDFRGRIAIEGGTVTAASTEGGAGIGAGAEGEAGYGGESTGSTTITGGTVIARAVNGGCAIGSGNGGDENGPLSLSDAVKVTAGSNTNGSNAELRQAMERTGACREHYARIEVCDHPQLLYTVTEETHLASCYACLEPLGPEEAHVFQDGVCACGLHHDGSLTVLTFSSGNELAIGSMEEMRCVYGSVTLLPACGYTVSGYDFRGWLAEGTDQVLQAGDEYTVGSNTVFTAVWGNAWSDLQMQIDAAQGSATLTLEEEVISSEYDSALSVAPGKNITLNLNGHTLCRAMPKGGADGHVITNHGTLTITDGSGSGTVTGGFSTGSGGGIVNNGTLTIAGGSLTGNQAAEGGAIFNAAGATLTLTGGSLNGNSADTYSGGAVVNRGTMTLSGGTISENTSRMNGGGIWSAGTISLSGGAVTDNTTGTGQNGGGIFCSAGTLNLAGAPVVSGSSVGNLYLKNSVSVQMTGALQEGLRIGLSCESYPASAEAPKTIATGITGYAGGFACDRDSYAALVNSAGELQLIVRPAYGTPDFTLPSGIAVIEAGAFEGAAMTVVSIPDGCESIGDYAFKDCAGLRQIRIPDGCALGTDVFSGCGTIFVYGTAGSPAEAYCQSHSNCVFVKEELN